MRIEIDYEFLDGEEFPDELVLQLPDGRRATYPRGEDDE